MPDNTDIMMPVPDESVMRQAEVIVLRQINENITRLNQRLDSQDEKQERVFRYIGEIREKLAADEVRRESSDELKADFKALGAKVAALEAVRNQQTGAAIFATYLKDFGPWIGTLLVIAWAFITRKPA